MSTKFLGTTALALLATILLAACGGDDPVEVERYSGLVVSSEFGIFYFVLGLEALVKWRGWTPHFIRGTMTS